MRTRNFWIGLAVAAVVLPAAMASARAEVVFKWANNGDVRAMDPYTLDETVQDSFLSNIYEPLVRRDKNLKVEPALAIKYEQTGPDTWRFHLRPGVKWADGSPFTADDVLFSYQRINSKTSQTSGNVSSVKEIHKINDLTVDFVTKSPDPILPAEFTNWPIVSKAWMTAHDAVEPAVVGSSQNYALMHSMGTGAFKLVDREPDRRTVLERNPGWWDKMVGNVDRVEFNVISSDATRVAALLSGEMDLIYTVPPQDIDRLKRSPGIKVLQTSELRNIYLGMDQKRNQLLFSNVKGKNPFKDVRVRRAFALAIDENAIAKVVMRGQGVPVWEMWGPGVNGYNKALDVRPKVNLAESRKLLAEAGYPKGFEVTLDCPNDRYIADEQICVAISSMMAKVGVKVDVFARTKVKFFADIAYPGFKTSFYLLGWTPSTYDADNVIRDHLMTTNFPAGIGIGNSAQYSNPKVDALEPQIHSELNPKKRQDLINQVIKIVQDDVGFIPLHQQVITWAAHNDISLVQPADDSIPMRFVVKK